MSHAKIPAIVALALLLVPGFAHAKRFELTPYAGYRWGGDIRDANSIADVALFDLEFQNGVNAGVMFNVVTSVPYLQLEALWDHQFAALQAKNNETGERIDIGDINIDNWHLGILYEISQVYEYTDEPPLRPFLGFTVGGSRFNPNDEDIGPEWRFSVAFMLGIKWFFAERLALRMQGRLLTTYFNSNNETFCDDAGRCFTLADAAFMNQFGLTMGVLFSF